jgi:hypothetical protein
MKVLEFPQTLAEKIDYLLQPVVTRPRAHELLSDAEIAAWQELIGKQFSSWARDPQQLGDDGIEAPSAETVQLAMNIARVLRDQNVESPDRVVPNGDGGIVFRWQSGDFTWSLELDADGSLETSLMEHDNLRCRHSLHTELGR